MKKRKEDEESMTLQTRRRLYEIILNNPGLHFREIVRLSGLSAGNVDYHLHYMERKEIIVAVQDGKFKRYYVRGRVDWRDKRIIALLRHENLRGIVLYLILNPGATISDLERDFDFSHTTLLKHVKKLQESGLVTGVTETPPTDQKQSGHEETRYYVTNAEHVADLLVSYRPTFRDALVDSFVEAWLGRKNRGWGRGNRKRKND